MATDTELTITRGDDVPFYCTFTLNGSALDVHECTIWFTAKADKTDADEDAIIQQYYTLAAGEGTAGTYTFILPKEKNTVPGSFFYDFQLVDRTGSVTTVGSGKLKVNQDITIDDTP